MIKFILLGTVVFLQGCSPAETYELKKYYKDSTSAAAKMMGGTYAGVIETFSSLEDCLQMKEQVERDDSESGYTNSRFVCDQK